MLLVICVLMGVATASFTHDKYDNVALTVLGFIIGTCGGIIGGLIYLLILKAAIPAKAS